MRSIIAALLCLVPLSFVEAKPSPYRADTFDGDKYRHVERVAQPISCPPPFGCPNVVPVRRSKAKHRRTKSHHIDPRPRPRPGIVAPLTMAEGFRREIRTAVAPFIRGRLICAANVGAELARRGQRGTGSRLAKSYLAWGRSSPPVPGAVAVFGRRGGGHVAIVHSVTPSGQVIYLNPSSRRQAWVIGPYRKRPIAYRVAS